MRPMTAQEPTPPPLSHYGRWIQAWARAAGQSINHRSLIELEAMLVEIVASRVLVFEQGQNDDLEFPTGGSVEEMAIAAELTPLLEQLSRLKLADRALSEGEQRLLASSSSLDRPPLSHLQELALEISDLVEEGLSPWSELGFTTTAYLPSELRVIGQHLKSTIDLYHL